MRPVTVIGLGPMGHAMARALLRAGHSVTVWNRTVERAAPLVADGAALAGSPADALAASDLVVLSLTDYTAMYDILEACASTLVGKVVINLSSDTPERSREAAVWAESHGARFVTGGVMVPAPMVGSDAAYVYYSGPRDVLDAHDDTLRVIGTPRFVGADPGLAQLYYQAQLDVFLTSLSAVLHATALVASAGVPPADFVPEAMRTLTNTAAMVGGDEELATTLTTGEHPGDLSTVQMMGATAAHIVATSDAAGVDLALPTAVRSHYDRAIAAGHGRDNWTSLYEIMRPGSR